MKPFHQVSLPITMTYSISGSSISSVTIPCTFEFDDSFTRYIICSNLIFLTAEPWVLTAHCSQITLFQLQAIWPNANESPSSSDDRTTLHQNLSLFKTLWICQLSVCLSFSYSFLCLIHPFDYPLSYNILRSAQVCFYHCIFLFSFLSSVLRYQHSIEHRHPSALIMFSSNSTLSLSTVLSRSFVIFSLANTLLDAWDSFVPLSTADLVI